MPGVLKAAPLRSAAARRQRRPLASGPGPARAGPSEQVAADQLGLPGRERAPGAPSSSAAIVQLAGGTSRAALRTVAGAIGSADPGPAARSHGIGTYRG